MLIRNNILKYRTPFCLQTFFLRIENNFFWSIVGKVKLNSLTVILKQLNCRVFTIEIYI